MEEAQVCITSDSYVNNVSKGFTYLQQNSEFVDMTLAAEGHLVKVHQNIVALASPFLKAMLQSAQCQHPVIFFSNISHKVLGYILEYIYMGEVLIPSNIVDTFIESCKSLCINGIDKIATSKNIPGKSPEPSIERIDKPSENFAAHITINTGNNYNLELVHSEQNKVNNDMQCFDIPSTSDMCNNTQTVMDFEAGTSQVDSYESVCENNVDINSIDNFLILKPNKTVNHNDGLPHLSKTELPVKILSSELINTKDLNLNVGNTLRRPSMDTVTNTEVGDWKTIPILISSNTKSIANQADSDWQTTTSQNKVVILNDSPMADSGSITSTDVWESKPSNVEMKLKTDSAESPLQLEHCQKKPIVINLTKNQGYVKKKRKTINSRIKSSINRLENNDKISQTKLNKSELDKKPHYSISNRGSLQLLLNHFLYHSHHNSHGGQKRRWRCIDYRRIHCPAFIDTDNDDVSAVSENHCHPNHDKQIRKKIKDNIVFTLLSNAVDTINTLTENQKV